MKSLKQKLIAVILPMIVILTLIVSAVVLFQSSSVTERCIEYTVEKQLKSTNNMLEMYLQGVYGEIKLNDRGVLTDKRGNSLKGNYEVIDNFSDRMGVVVTIFTRDGNDFVRLLTNIKDENGQRAIETKLDSSGAAYSAATNGNEYYGEAEILGNQYMTGYKPFFDKDGNVIGIYFVGIPIAEITVIVKGGMLSTLRNIVLVILISILAAGGITILISNKITEPIKNVTYAANKIAKGEFDVELSVDSKDEVGQPANSFRLTIDRLVNYQEYIDEISEALLCISHGNLTFRLQKEYEGQFKKLKLNMEELLSELGRIVHDIGDAAYQVDLSAVGVSEGAKTLSDGSIQQASSIEELSASFSEVSSQICVTDDNANIAREKSSVAEQELENSNAKMNEMVEAMGMITKKSFEISKIIKINERIGRTFHS